MKPDFKRDSKFSEFMTLLNKYADYANSAGKKVYRSPHQDALQIFNGLNAERQSNLIRRLETDLKIFDEMTTSKEGLNNSKQMLWRYLGETGHTPCSDIFDHIEVGDILEIYGPDQIHLWQNLEFFDWSSISLERLYSDTWYEASKRDENIQKSLFKTATEIFTGKIEQTVPSGVPWHVIEEIESELLLKFDIQIKVLSPIFKDRQVAGLITINQCRSAS